MTNGERGTKNLIPTTAMSVEEQRAFASKGGQAASAKREHAKTFKEALNWYLEKEFKPDSGADFAIAAEFPELTNREALAIAAVEQSTRDRDVKSMIFVRDTSGEVPRQSIELEQSAPFEINIKTVE